MWSHTKLGTPRIGVYNCTALTLSTSCRAQRLPWFFVAEMNVAETRPVFLDVGAHCHAEALVRCQGGLELGSRGHRGHDSEEKNTVNDGLMLI